MDCLGMGSRKRTFTSPNHRWEMMGANLAFGKCDCHSQAFPGNYSTVKADA